MANPIATRRTTALKTANQIVIERLELALATARELDRQGYALVPGGVDVNAVRPTLEVQPDGHCRRMIEQGAAAYFHCGVSPVVGRFRAGQFPLGDCRVVWLEQGR
jgi:hypothetical protein